MKAFVIIVGLAILALVAPASADHMGPCTHEYLDPAVDGVRDYKNGGLLRIPGGTVSAAGSCSGNICRDTCDLTLP